MALIDLAGAPPIEANLYADTVQGLLAAAGELAETVAEGFAARIEWRSANATPNGDGWQLRATARLILQTDDGQTDA